jgi:hypothetical protein
VVPCHGDGAGGGVGAGAVVGGARARQNQTGFAGDGRGTEGLDWKLDGVAEKERRTILRGGAARVVHPCGGLPDCCFGPRVNHFAWAGHQKHAKSDGPPYSMPFFGWKKNKQ